MPMAPVLALPEQERRGNRQVASGAAAAGRPALLFSLVLAAVFAILYGQLLWQKEAQYQTYAYDLGLFVQVAWNTLHGQPFATTLLAFNYLGDHLAPSLALVAPLFLLWPDARALLLLQAIAVAGAGVGIFLAARERSSDSRPALLIQLGYHLAPAAAWVALDEFHPISLALPALTFATALLWRRRYGLAAGCAALALLSTEDAVSWVVPFGLLLLVLARGRARLWGAALMTTGVAWIALYLFLLAPTLRPVNLVQSDPHPDIGVFIYCGRTWSAVAQCLTHQPSLTLHQLLRPAGQSTLAVILGPTAGLGLLGPANYTQHYVALLVPAAYLAAGEAAGRLRRRRVPPRLAALVVAVASLLAFIQQSPLPGGGGYAAPAAGQVARSALLDRAVAMIPTDPARSVVATSQIFPHIALRANAYLPWAAPARPADYTILDLRDAYPISDQQLRERAAVWLADPNEQILLQKDDIVVLKRGSVAPDVASHAAFGKVVALLGYSMQRAEGTIDLQLFWRAQQPVGSQYHLFVHLVDRKGRTFSQKDSSPIDGGPPSFRWAAGQELRDAVVLAAPPGPWNQYHLEIGWYDWRSGRRLLLPDGGDHAVAPLTG
ncbi:MAG TPA: DUF2079 domain-containing protein [Chloroflexota bacterium]|nr:DUF2079 domain-containing protein [Chloroflexota bacterium]